MKIRFFCCCPADIDMSRGRPQILKVSEPRAADWARAGCAVAAGPEIRRRPRPPGRFNLQARSLATLPGHPALR